MWLMTRHGFYSVVQKEAGIYHIRAREVGDLEVLTAPAGPLPGEEIRYGRSDYPFRLIVGGEEVRRLLAWLADTLDYKNFKAAVDREPSQRRKPYVRVWALLATALGSYGRSPLEDVASGLGRSAGRVHGPEDAGWERPPLEDVSAEANRGYWIES